jgi:pseudouridine synthase
MKAGPDARQDESGGRVRLQRFLADAGVAARRTCEAMIERGRVRVNGEVVRRLPVFVDPATDRIDVDGVGVKGAVRRVYVMLHKPERVLVTTADEPGAERRTVADLVDHPAASRLFPVGRLDFAACGLVLLTNDGELANRLTHPRYGVEKRYEAAVRGGLDVGAARAVRQKLAAPGGREAPEIRVTRDVSGGAVLEITIREGRGRELREVLKHLGMPVKRLTRVAIGPLELRALGPGRWRELTRDEVQALRRAGGKPEKARSGKARVPMKKGPAAGGSGPGARGEPASTARPRRRARVIDA